MKDARLQDVYAGYDTSPAVRRRWSGDNVGNLRMLGERNRALAQMLASRTGRPLRESIVLDAGSGWGHALAWLAGLGVPTANMTGVDLMANRVTSAQAAYEGITFIQGDMATFDRPDKTFDLVICSTLFSSIRDAATAVKVAANVRRILRDDGAVVWYDIRYPNPWNRNVMSMRRSRIRRLFPDLSLRLRSITLVPQVSRRLGRAVGLYPVLAAVPPLRTHLAGLLEARHA